MHQRALLAAVGSSLVATGAVGAQPGIAVDRYGRTGPAVQPAIVLLHGSDGFTNSGRYEFAAETIASAGYAVFVLRYFDATGESQARCADIQSKFPAWRKAIESVLAADAESAPGVAPGRVGVVGFSLGGALALALAARTTRIKAVIDFFGFAPAGLEDARSLPPTLILHGDADRVVPVSNAASIERIVKSRGGIVETRIHPGEGHGLSISSLPDAIGKTQEFLRRYV